MRKLLGPLVIALTLVVASVVQGLFGTGARAQSAKPPVPAVVAQNDAPAAGAPADAQPASEGNNAAQLGTENDLFAERIYKHVYGPTDQSKPLDFSTQPASVPHTYVPGKLYNVQVLKGYTYATLLGQMAAYTSALGVQCTYCHNTTNYAYDTPTKKIARTMQIMSNGVTTAWIEPVKKAYPNYAVTGAVGCVTCHRGQVNIGVHYNVVPVQYLLNHNKSTKQAGSVVNSMYSAARSLGVNCLFCHNSADFVTLQYYPTNQIAQRMWAMVDDINHKYLPADIKAVTCYTCHQGNQWPTALVEAGLNQSPVQPIAAHPEVHLNPGAHLASGAAP
jgi:hypothetical protein